MSQPSLPNDPLWPRAGHWISAVAPSEAPKADLALLGIPAHRTSITPTGAHETPAAVREALMRYSTYSASHNVDVSDLTAIDLGDVTDPDGPEGEARVAAAVRRALDCELLIAVGGDNSITHSVVRGLVDDLSDCGLVTVDAHHDLRDGVSNGSPVRRLLDAGLPGSQIVQLGIADFSNSAQYAARAADRGITVVYRDDMRPHQLAGVVSAALDVAGHDGRPVFVDLDVDVCDRAAVPGCPSAAPGGLSADDLRHLAFLFGRDPRVVGIDIAEVDAGSDSPDGRTVRLAALLVLEAAAGLCVRKELLRT